MTLIYHYLLLSAKKRKNCKSVVGIYLDSTQKCFKHPLQNTLLKQESFTF
jgi:hypothetical protein